METPADHAEVFAHRYASDLDAYCAIRMEELGIPSEKIGAPNFDHGGRWRAFEPSERTGGSVSSGVYVNSGVLNLDLLKGGRGGRVWAKARLRDRIDAIIAHEWEESRHVTHEAALREAPRTGLPITNGARRILKAMSR